MVSDVNTHVPSVAARAASGKANGKIGSVVATSTRETYLNETVNGWGYVSQSPRAPLQYMIEFSSLNTEVGRFHLFIVCQLGARATHYHPTAFEYVGSLHQRQRTARVLFDQ